MDLEDAAAELYAGPPAEFMARRAELVREARQQGDTAAAKAIGELRKPTVSAWLVNQLVRDDEGARQIDRLTPLGDQLRTAQEQLDPTQLKKFGQQRQSAVTALIRQAAGLSEGKLSPAVQRELEETFTAAVASEQAALAVGSGRLTRALAYSGFGDVDVTAATATPLRSSPSRSPSSLVAESGPAVASGAAAPSSLMGTTGGPRGSARPGVSRRTRPARPAPDPDESGENEAAVVAEAARRQRQADRLRAADEAQQAAADLAAAQADLADAEQRRHDAREEESRLTTRLEELQAKILDARHQLDAVARTIAGAAREYSRRERQVRDADRAAHRAAAALDDLSAD